MRLAIISSSTSEGFRDFVTILDQSNRKIEYQLFEARVHGDQARGDIADQLKQIGSNPSSWSAIIITR